jgi:hypothetical protein
MDSQSAGGGDPNKGPEVNQSNSTASSEPALKKNVAIIAIHGVGQHISGASADAVSTLLTSIGRDKVVTDKSKEAAPAPPYSGFTSVPINVPLRPIQAAQDYANEANVRSGQGSLMARLWSIFDERRGYLAQARNDPGFKPFGYSQQELRKGEPDRGEFSYQFMLTQVAGYRGEVDREFATVRLEGQRAPTSPAANVHIYDAHYSDLTKPQNSILSFFFAFYQLLFHLAGLSLLAVYWAERENTKEDPARRRRWYIKSSVSAAAVRLLTMVVPCLNLILLTLGGCALTQKVFCLESLHEVLAFGLAGLLGLAATFFVVRREPSPPRPFLWAMIPFLGPFGGVLLLSGLAYFYICLLHCRMEFWEALLLFSWLLAAGAVLVWIAWKFQPLRPGVLPLTIVLYALSLVLFLGCLLPKAAWILPEGSDAVPLAAFWAVQWIFAALSVAWLLCLFFALLSWPLGVFCIRGIRSEEAAAKRDAALKQEKQAQDEAKAKVVALGTRRSRAAAAFRTGRFAFAVPAILFMIVTTALWSGVVVYGSEKLKVFDGLRLDDVKEAFSNRDHAWPSWFIPQIGPVQNWIAVTSNNPARAAESQTTTASFWSVYLKGLLLVSVTPGLSITVLLFSVSLLLLAWAVLPPVVYEIKPEWTSGARSNRIRWLGEWLSRGLDNIAILTRVLWAAIVPIPLFFYVLAWLALRHELPSSWLDFHYRASELTLPLIEVTGLILAVSAAGFVGVLLKGLTTVLDTILDVDNYLRTSPLDETPRARIAERCVSLLRYIAARRDEHGNPYYSKVIFVAHSLGSMVTTDLLRYLERSAKDSPDPGLEPYGFRQTLTTKSGRKKVPIYVFSMGSPLRQLLNRFFPHLYWWVRDEPDNSLGPVGAALDPPIAEIANKDLPRSDEMNVHLWVNAYRSGDYIGRSLWLGQWLTRNSADNPHTSPDVAIAGPPQTCEEMCIGLGAHTHYWDRSAPEIARKLDQLISRP